MANTLASVLSKTKAATGNYGDEAVQAGKAIGQKGKMINDYVDGSASAPKSVDNGTSSKDKINPKAQYGDKPGEKRPGDPSLGGPNAAKPLGSYKKGGKIKKTGVYKLHKSERVLNAKQTKQLSGLAKGLAK